MHSFFSSNQEEVDYCAFVNLLSKIKHYDSSNGKGLYLDELQLELITKTTDKGYNFFHVAALSHEYDLFLALKDKYKHLIHTRDYCNKNPCEYFLESWAGDVRKHSNPCLAKYLIYLIDWVGVDLVINNFYNEVNSLKTLILGSCDSQVLEIAKSHEIINSDDVELVFDIITTDIWEFLNDNGYEDSLPVEALVKVVDESRKYSIDYQQVVSLIEDIPYDLSPASLGALKNGMENIASKKCPSACEKLRDQALELFEAKFSVASLRYN